MKPRRLREGDVLEDGGIALGRGGVLEPDILHADAMRYHRVYGSYGIPVFAVRGATLDEIAQQLPLVRFPTLRLIKVAAVRGAGCGWSRAGATPATTRSAFDDLDLGIAAMAGRRHQVVANPYQDAQPGCGRRCDGPGDRPGSRPQCRRRRGARLVGAERGPRSLPNPRW